MGFVDVQQTYVCTYTIGDTILPRSCTAEMDEKIRQWRPWLHTYMYIALPNVHGDKNHKKTIQSIKKVMLHTNLSKLKQQQNTASASVSLPNKNGGEITLYMPTYYSTSGSDHVLCYIALH